MRAAESFLPMSAMPEVPEADSFSFDKNVSVVKTPARFLANSTIQKPDPAEAKGSSERSSVHELSRRGSPGVVPCGRIGPCLCSRPQSNHHQLRRAGLYRDPST